LWGLRFSVSGSDPKVAGLQAVSRARRGIEHFPMLTSERTRVDPVPDPQLLTTG